MESLGLLRLQVLVEIVDSGGFGTAAKILNLTQPAISFHARALESSFGTPLFQEPRRAVKLTETGSRVYLFAKQVIHEANTMVRAVKALQSGESGRVVFGASTSTGAGRVPKVLATFQKSHPGAEVVLRVRSSGELCQQVLAGKLDCALVLAEAVPAELEVVPVCTEKLYFVTAPDHPLQSLGRVSATDISDVATVLAPRESVHTRIVDKWFAAHGANGPRVVAEIQSSEGLVTAVEVGLGISVLFECTLYHALALETIKYLDVEHTPITASVVLVRRPGAVVSPLMERFCSFLIRFLA
jgi:DNA-binding transcriptional LysR family regulator